MRHHSGRVEIICGSMFCGKTEELIRRVRRAIIARQTVQVFKPKVDDRFGIQTITSHTGQKHDATAVADPHDIFALIEKRTTVIAIDEVQFLTQPSSTWSRRWRSRGCASSVLGLTSTFAGSRSARCPSCCAAPKK